MSRPRPSVGGQFGVATWGRLPRHVATNARLACARPAHAERATCASCARDQLAVRAAVHTTWALRAQCARDLGSGCAHCTLNPVL